MSVYIPENHNAVSPYLIVKNVSSQIDFMGKVFNAVVLFQMKAPDGSIKHASIKIDDSVIMVGERPDGREPVLCSTHVYVPDVDHSYAVALGEGAYSLSEPKDQPYGDRTAGIKDLEGNIWWIGTYIRKS